MSVRSILPTLITLALTSPAFPAAPPLVLAEEFHEHIDVSHYWVSEKYDGARAWWDGEKFLSRSGNIYHAPVWFTRHLPTQVLDGELWIGRSQFQLLMQTIRDAKPDDEAWRKVSFMVFDAPRAPGYFSDRQASIANLLSEIPDPWIRQAPQWQVTSHRELNHTLEEMTARGAEGLMLRKEQSHYTAGRHIDLLKLKTYQDAEAVVLSHRRGKGKYRNVLGSLLVEDKHGTRFRIGSGFTDEERANPPPPGSIVTYRYQGKTNAGKPRFARYLRMKPVETE